MRLVKNERSILFVSVLTIFAVILGGSKTSVKGYPMMLEVYDEEERCLRFNIPEDDDAHMVFLVIPSSEYGEDEEEENGTPQWIQNYKSLETHFMGQMHEITKRRTKNEALIRKFPVKPPADVQASMDDFMKSFDGNMKTGVTVRLTNPKSTNSRSMDTYWFNPLVVNHVRRAIRTQKKDRESSPLEGYSACFINDGTEMVHVVVDSVMVGEGPEYDDDDNASEDPTFQGHHLEPLAQQLADSVRSAQTVINEMRYMERREARMRHTADSINKRVQKFSYISIVILLVVTYLQVTYLKRYFRKKKLL
mmetsp:Transcript_713/g.1712  ORF Transcript_713/g.1712 Transcript_713/m.1712 type:complete len:307 (-) Transcript_713:263-1183(-)|eukprot:CAMPEP_0116132032 /NCGR_PEP_ID=MMETSP0329-20121206/9331_1 /TAXON_ID=697910 /ORGANISM="Pseudo-nitzschia arenysensis, Strain B593" /LENGTH=306 /DNA_ID=CAMNT_0003626519 /DNA_START=181 /DNA_END=1101 /DNA_ORIENTATION=-